MCIANHRYLSFKYLCIMSVSTSIQTITPDLLDDTLPDSHSHRCSDCRDKFGILFHNFISPKSILISKSQNGSYYAQLSFCVHQNLVQRLPASITALIRLSIVSTKLIYLCEDFALMKNHNILRIPEDPESRKKSECVCKNMRMIKRVMVDVSGILF